MILQCFLRSGARPLRVSHRGHRTISVLAAKRKQVDLQTLYVDLHDFHVTH